MKTIMALTDFSEQANNAAAYAYQFAHLIKADLLLFNAFGNSEKSVVTYPTKFPLNYVKYDELHHKSEILLKNLANRLKSKFKDSDENNYRPKITIKSAFGELTALTSELVIQNSIGLVVISGPKSNHINRLIFGSDTYNLLDIVLCPILLIPDGIKYKVAKKISYATDYRSADYAVINSLCSLAALFDAEVFITHVSQKEIHDKDKLHQNLIDPTLYPRINYQNITGKNVIQALIGMNINPENKSDILVLVHKKYHFPESLFHISISKQMAKFANVPMIVYPFTFIEYLSQPKAVLI